MLRRTLFVLSTTVLVACGGGPSPNGGKLPSPAPIAKAPPVDLSPVPEPAGLLLLGRLNKPEALVKAVGTWAHLPLPGGKELVRSVTDAAVAEVVDVDQPIDAAVAVSGGGMRAKPALAFAVAVRSFDDAKTKLAGRHKMTPGPNGSFKVEGIGRGGEGRGEMDGEDDDDGDGCVLAPAVSGRSGGTAARLVCGEPAALESLVPYLTRTMPRENWPSDFHIEVRPAPVREPLAQVRSSVPVLLRGMFNQQSPAFRELADAAMGEVVDLVNDAQRITLDGQIAESGIVATTRFEYQKATSLVARVTTAHPEKAAPPPASFWHLPADTDVAIFGHGTDPQLFDHPKQLIANVLIEMTEGADMPEPERKSVRELIADRALPLFTNGPGLYAKGYDAAALDKAMTARRSVKPGDLGATDEAERVLAEQAIGWHVFQVDEPIDKVAAILKDWSQLWNRPAFAKWVKQKTASKMLARVRVAPPPAGVTLPKDAVHLEITIPRADLDTTPPPVQTERPVSGRGQQSPPLPKATAPAPPPAKGKTIARKPIVMHVFAVPDGAKSSWLAFGLDAKLVAQKVAASLATAPDTNTIGKTAAGHEALREAKVNSAGFVSLRGLLVLTAVGGGERSPFAAAAATPNKGSTPVLLSFNAEAPSDKAKAGAFVSTIRLPRGTIEDAVKILMSQ